MLMDAEAPDVFVCIDNTILGRVEAAPLYVDRALDNMELKLDVCVYQ